MSRYQRLGEMLIAKGLITEADLIVALSRQSRTGMRIGQLLASGGMASEEQVAQCLAEQYDFPFVDPAHIKVDPKALDFVSPKVAYERVVLPVRITPNALYCVVADPLDIGLTDELQQSARRPVILLVAPATKLYRAIQEAYDGYRPAVGGTNERAADQHRSAMSQGQAASSWDRAFMNEGGKKRDAS